MWFWGIGFAGLGLSRLVADRFFGGEKEFLKLPVGHFLVLFFAFLWLVAALALFPMAIIRQKRRMAESEMTIYPWWQWLLLVPYFEHDHDARVPRWISLPLIGLALLFALLLLAIFLALGIHQLMS